MITLAYIVLAFQKKPHSLNALSSWMNRTALQRTAGVASSSASVAPTSYYGASRPGSWRSTYTSMQPPLLPQPHTQTLSPVVAQAQRVRTQPVDDFLEVHETLAQRSATSGFLPKEDTLTLILSMRSADHGLRVLQLLASMLKVRSCAFRLCA